MKKVFLLAISLLLIQALEAQDSIKLKPRIYKIKITTLNSTKIHAGYLFAISDSCVFVSPSAVKATAATTTETSISKLDYTNIKTVQLRRKGSTGRGILIGAASGAIPGAILGYADGNDFEKNQGSFCFLCLTAGEKAMGAGVVFGVAGGLIGGIIGALVNKTFIIEGNKENFNLMRSKILFKQQNQLQ